jgi:hypothetical protein
MPARPFKKCANLGRWAKIVENKSSLYAKKILQGLKGYDMMFP